MATPGARKRGPGADAPEKPSTRRTTRGKGEEVPSVGQWIATQTTNLDTTRREAARHIVGRWDPEWLNYSHTLRTLEREHSEHLLGAQMLGDDYASVFNLAPSDQVKKIGLAGPLIPIDTARCSHTTNAGSQCTRYGAPGNDKCWQHGGTWVTQDELERISAHVGERLVEGTNRAVRVLLELMDDGKSEMVRLQAALGWLDRAGAGPTSKINLEVTNSAEEAAAEIRRRIDELASNAAVAAERIANEPSA